MNTNAKYRVECFINVANVWQARIVSTANGQTLATSEPYDSKRNMLDTWRAFATSYLLPLMVEDGEPVSDIDPNAEVDRYRNNPGAAPQPHPGAE